MQNVIDSPIRAIRKLRGLTAEQLAARAGLASATVYRAERGIGTPTEGTLDALAVVLEVEVAALHEPEADIASTAVGSDRQNPPDNAQAPDRTPVAANHVDGIRAGAR